MRRSIRYPQFAVITVLLSIPTLAPAQSARISPRISDTKDAVYVTIDVPGSTLTCATGISPNGKIVGVYTTDQDLDPSRDCWHSAHLTGFVLEGDRFTDLEYPVPPGPINVTVPLKINAKGTIVGFWVSQQPPESIEGGWIWEKGKFSDVKYSGAVPQGEDASFPQITDVFGINSSGDMSGGVAYLKNRDAWNGLHGWFYDASKGTFQSFDPDDCWFTFPFDINDRGDIAGRCEPRDGPPSGFVRDKEGTIRQVDSVPDSWNALAQDATGINSGGAIIGRYYVDFPGWGPVPHAYVLSNGVFTSIDPPGAGGATPWGISPSGIIVGSYAVPDENGMPRIHGFVRIPKGRL